MVQSPSSAEFLDSFDRIDSLPPQVRRIEVRTDPHAVLTHRLAQSQQGLIVVDNKPWMHLDAKVHLLLCKESGLLFPIRDHLLLPLPIEDFAKLVWPSASHPVRVLRPRLTSRASTETVHALHTQHVRELHRLHERLMVLLRNRVDRMQRVSVTRDRRESQSSRLDLLHELVPLGLAPQKLVHLQVCRARIRPAAKFDRLDPLLLHDVEGLVERLIAKKRSENTDLHARLGVYPNCAQINFGPEGDSTMINTLVCLLAIGLPFQEKVEK